SGYILFCSMIPPKVTFLNCVTGLFSLYSLMIETGEKRKLTFPPEKTVGDSGSSFSLDGRTLAFSRSIDGGVSDLYLLDVAKELKPFGEPKRLTFSNRITTCSVWTASGQEIIFSSGYANSSSLWRIGIAGSSPPQRLASVGGNADEIA